MRNKHGDFIWYELMTGDAEAASAFYGAVLGWRMSKAPGGMDYHQVMAEDGDFVGGMLPLNEDMRAGGARACWVGYIGVDDVDASAAAITKAGGRVLMPARDIPGVGRIAMVSDPQGVPFYIMRGAVDGVSRAFASERPQPGHCAWNELFTTDQAAAVQFYGKQFGWTVDGEMDMGPLGKYQFLRHGFMLGAVMTKPPHVPVPGWNFYFRVTDIDTATATVKARGGQVLHGPQEVPGGDFVINGIDPQGAGFALVGRKA
jgi:predicted enzyme related to lactoylglutathione lyase